MVVCSERNDTYAHQSYEQLFGVKQTGPTDYVRGKIWLSISSANGGQVRGQYGSDGRSQDNAGGVSQSQQISRGLA